MWRKVSKGRAGGRLEAPQADTRAMRSRCLDHVEAASPCFLQAELIGFADGSVRCEREGNGPGGPGKSAPDPHPLPVSRLGQSRPLPETSPGGAWG